MWDLQVQAGAYFSNNGAAPQVAQYNFIPIELRFGLITDIGFGEGMLRGNFEPMLGLSVGDVLKGAGHGYVGPSLTLRYNFVQPNWRLVPYVQICGGVTYNDGYKDTSQVALSGGMEFLLQAQVGVRWFVTDRLSFNFEAGYIHISDADTVLPNYGVNAFGASLGLSYSFGRRCP